jgi:hypothetical protein
MAPDGPQRPLTAPDGPNHYFLIFLNLTGKQENRIFWIDFRPENKILILILFSNSL